MIPLSQDTPIPTTPVSMHERTDRELELAVLERIHTVDRVRQRDLADAVGASLGMTNAIVKRLSRKGLLTLRKVNNRNVAYAVTPAGLEAITRKSYRYLKKTISSVVRYKDALEALVLGIRSRGYRSILMAGGSQLAFVLEHLCARHGIAFRQQKSTTVDVVKDGVFLLYAEHIEPDSIPLGATGAATRNNRDYLLRILVSAVDDNTAAPAGAREWK